MISIWAAVGGAMHAYDMRRVHSMKVPGWKLNEKNGILHSYWSRLHQKHRFWSVAVLLPAASPAAVAGEDLSFLQSNCCSALRSEGAR